MSRKRVAVAMSGGVDSSVAAALLKQKNYDVIGITMQIIPFETEICDKNFDNNSIETAKSISLKLGIPHFVIDLTEIFFQKVISNFYDEYSNGRTPNPCIRCNEFIKFNALLEKVRDLSADYLATGHYARIKHHNGFYYLLKGKDQFKDQAYFLYTLGQYELRHLMFPLGNHRKDDIRKIAIELGLPVMNRDSQDVCFIPNNNYRTSIVRNTSYHTGQILDTDGNILGNHDGLFNYTIGQRHGLGLASKKRLYVLRLDTESNCVIVGNEEKLWSNTLIANQLNWVLGENPQNLCNITAKVRYRSKEDNVALHISNDCARVDFLTPQRSITPGQSVVFYNNDLVLGGGIIERIDDVGATNFN